MLVKKSIGIELKFVSIPKKYFIGHQSVAIIDDMVLHLVLVVLVHQLLSLNYCFNAG